MQELIEFICSHSELKSAPPVLIDIGASGEVHAAWKEIAKYSICIAFDADEREMLYTEKATDDFHKLYVINRIVTPEEQSEQTFYLTKSPYCSSLLQPAIQALEIWDFQELFEVVTEARIATTTLSQTLKQVGIDRVDWFKTDSQGIDLRLFKSLGELTNRTLVAEFESGIIDAYEGEDKLYLLLQEMEKSAFWLSSLDIKGARRMNLKALSSLSEADQLLLKRQTKFSACWANTIYMNKFTEIFGKREFLLGCVFAIMQKQYAFAVELCINAEKLFADNVFHQIQQKITTNLQKMEMLPKITFQKRIVNAITRRLQKFN